MIARISSALMLACLIPSFCVYGLERSSRNEPVVIQMPQQEVWLTPAQAQHLLSSVEHLVHQMNDLSKQNRAPRPEAPVAGDPSYPGCGLVDLSGVLAALCLIENQLVCVCQELYSVADVLGSCTDSSVLLGSQVDKSCIDGLCLSVVSLLKTVLLEIRGAFTTPFPCNVTP